MRTGTASAPTAVAPCMSASYTPKTRLIAASSTMRWVIVWMPMYTNSQPMPAMPSRTSASPS